MRITTQQVALLYHMLGWILVPLDGKIPPRGCRLKDYLSKQTQSRKEIEMLFPKHYQKNIGIVTGLGSNLVVVDLDSSADFPWVAKRFGDTPFVVRTGKQGFHFYYRYPAKSKIEIRCKTRLWGRKIDLRAIGGYVVSPKSQHPETKKAYQWITPFTQLSPDNMPEFNPGSLPKQISLPTSPLSLDCHNKDVRIKRARRYLDRVTCISGQAAHNTLFRACCKLIELFDLNKKEMKYLLIEWNRNHCFDHNQQSFPWSDKELDHKISDALKAVSFRTERN